jgi:hypothetical protein
MCSTSAKNDLRLALAREFQAVVTLRHPHIVSVLDFDELVLGDYVEFYNMHPPSKARCSFTPTCSYSIEISSD